ncbi:lysine--tRNA ligase [Candidatus Gottesmanbacteria bacterium]|nr:lysine--tRNA ligase [Candidatus Gottesmanbacteria bacterium]
MFWADKIAKNIIDSRKYTPYWVDDMKTPSGRIHVGSLRGVLIHELVWRALKNAGKEATFTYVFDDHDPMDELPIYLEEEKWSKYLGQPLYTVPSPDGKAENYAKYFADEFTEVFNKLGCRPKILWTSELYKKGMMNDLIKVCLDKTELIRKIYEELYKKKMVSDWYPFQVVCPKCGKESTTRVNNWDGENVSFVCKIDAVVWTKGCGFYGSVSPFSGDGKFAGKLSWKIEWPVKWQVIGITIEGAGKDHMSAGGSHDVAKLICERVLKSAVPYQIAYEFFLIGGKKMSSSKGLGSSAKEVSEIIPPYLGRFLFTRTDYREAIEFDPMGTMAIPDLFDEYDRCWQAYNTGSDENLSSIFEYSQIDDIPGKNPTLFLPRFRDIANFAQLPNVDLWQKLQQIKGTELTEFEDDIIRERLTFAFIWLSKYAPDEYRYQISIKSIEEINLTSKQWEFLNVLSDIWANVKDPEELQSKIFQLAKAKDMNHKEAFNTLYTVLLDKPHGPRAGWLLKKFPSEVVIKRLTLNRHQKVRKQARTVNTISRPDLFTIDKEVKSKYPSVSIGIAIIKGVNIKKSDPLLEKAKEEFLKSLENLTTEEIGKYPQLISYRKLYREMGIDWHSRRPSPEALLRRVILKKGLYSINTCVDAYNLVVMKHRVSVGAFDLECVRFPTVLRYADEGDEILLLGDKEPTKYTSKEIAYYDKVGGYNIDFNYRDAQRTMVTEKTKNIWINVDGVYDISPELVEKSLRESIEIIVKYCGGEVEFEGVVR